MERVRFAERPMWRSRVERLGFGFHTIGGEPYWDETAAYRFTAAEIDGFDDLTAELHGMCLQIVDSIVTSGDFDRLGLSPRACALITASWRRGDPALYGRFDFSYDGRTTPKLLEYNADTPTSLFEAGVIQWDWLEQVKPRADQFNSIHEKLVARWAALFPPGARVHFTCLPDNEEDRGTIDYLRDTAMQGGCIAPFVEIADIGYDGQRFVDFEDRPIDTLFKLYPWEWMIQDAFAGNIGPSGLRLLEPAWKMILSNKALMVLLWERFPGHPALLPASFKASDISGPMVKKPLFSREGANVALMGIGGDQSVPGPYGAEGFIYQAAAPLPCIDGNYPVIGSWVIGERSAGLGIREDLSPITTDASRFLPHYFE
ncbi:glutathionylspermidine synthase family protein [Lacibacterium aquatile]|uniref:Glutathionylspermidine synthase family protein n=1 Tax=Lacibacterium aquatile TaxID=1168082 RepID=A0ABW5DRW4_9PROT